MPEEGSDIIGRLQQAETRYEDTFSDIARLNDLGYREMVAANPGIDPWLPGAGAELVLPSQFILPPGPRKGIVINLPELRIYYYSKDGKTVTTHPLGIGRDGWNTPIGKAKVTRKKEGPTWTPPASIRAEHAAKGDILPDVVKAGPDNPLGTHAIYLSLPGSYLLHGTNKPFGVGMRVSHGCIRLYPEDIASIFTKIPVVVPVSIINEPYRAGWIGDQFYVEAHPVLVDGLDDDGQVQETKVNITPMMRVIVNALGEKDNVDINWQGLSSIAQSALGFPLPIGNRVIEVPILDPTDVSVNADKTQVEKKFEQLDSSGSLVEKPEVASDESAASTAMGAADLSLPVSEPLQDAIIVNPEAELDRSVSTNVFFPRSNERIVIPEAMEQPLPSSVVPLVSETLSQDGFEQILVPVDLNLEADIVPDTDDLF